MIYIAVFVIVAIVVIWIGKALKAVAASFGYKPFDKNNPYYKDHIKKTENDKKYQEYLRWAHKNNQDFVVTKSKNRQEVEQDRKLNDLFK